MVKTIRIFGRPVALKKVFVVKGVVAVGLSAIHFLPPEIAVHVNWITNLIWLFGM